VESAAKRKAAGKETTVVGQAEGQQEVDHAVMLEVGARGDAARLERAKRRVQAVGVDKHLTPEAIEAYLAVAKLAPLDLTKREVELHPIDWPRGDKFQTIPHQLVAGGKEGLVWVGNLPCGGDPPSHFAHEDPTAPSEDYILCVASQLAFEIRSALFLEHGFTTSAGIASSPMLAKLASSMYKPNQQTVMREGIKCEFMSEVKLEKVPGFGPKSQVISSSSS
jgi:nucleotidyltransferase/DNA polymerase involved in DNA repair